MVKGNEGNDEWEGKYGEEVRERRKGALSLESFDIEMKTESEVFL